MPTFAIALSERERAFLLAALTQDIIARGKRLENIDPKRQPAQHANAIELFYMAVKIHAQLAASLADPCESDHTPYELDPQAVKRAADEGIDLHRELFDHDPRASAPRCVHGMAFTEPCDLCDSPSQRPETDTPPA